MHNQHTHIKTPNAAPHTQHNCTYNTHQTLNHILKLPSLHIGTYHVSSKLKSQYIHIHTHQPHTHMRIYREVCLRVCYRSMYWVWGVECVSGCGVGRFWVCFGCRCIQGSMGYAMGIRLSLPYTPPTTSSIYTYQLHKLPISHQIPYTPQSQCPICTLQLYTFQSHGKQVPYTVTELITHSHIYPLSPNPLHA